MSTGGGAAAACCLCVVPAALPSTSTSTVPAQLFQSSSLVAAFRVAPTYMISSLAHARVLARGGVPAFFSFLSKMP